MDKLVVKVGANPMDDLRNVWNNPKKNARPGAHIVYVKDVCELRELLSTERLKLTMSLMNESIDVSTTAKKLGRKQEAISRDASILEAAGLITKTKKGRQTFLKTKFKKIEIDFS